MQLGQLRDLTGYTSVVLFQVYHLAGVRLRELCDQLQVHDEDLRSKMWTCFEHALTECSDLMCDRHLDQLLMCAVYIMAKVTEKPLNFQDIMKCYRYQPQAQSHVSASPRPLCAHPCRFSPCRQQFVCSSSRMLKGCLRRC